MLAFKAGVKIKGLQPEALLGMILAEQIFAASNLKLIVTSCIDGQHMSNSLHYKGQAFDVRIWNLSDPSAMRLALSSMLGPLGFDVILETNHFHIEYDPKS